MAKCGIKVEAQALHTAWQGNGIIHKYINILHNPYKY